ncbi:MAG: nicotinamide riboside transporter PnuC, partial [Anaeromyxobacteraceae bacterium]
MSGAERVAFAVAALALAAAAPGTLRAAGIDPLEALAFASGAAGVWLMTLESAWGWPLGMASCAALAVVFWGARLYADMALQLGYVLLDAVGWWWWTRPRSAAAPLLVSRAPRTVALALVAGAVVVTPALTLLLRRLDDAAPFWDAFTTALSLAGQLLLTRKHVEAWSVYALVNVVYVGLYVARGL